MNPVISKALQAKTSPFFNTFFYARFVTEGRPTEGVQDRNRAGRRFGAFSLLVGAEMVIF